MGFFNFLKKEKKDLNKNKIMLPIIEKVENVNEAIFKISKEYDIPISSLDFKILDVKTYIKTEHYSDFIEYEEIEKFLKDEDFLRNEKNYIKQVYKIEINKYKVNDSELIGKIQINKKFTEAKFIVSSESLLTDDFNKLKNEINKKKIRNGLLISLFDEKMDKFIENVIYKVKMNDLIENEEEIFICKGLDEIPTIQGEIIYYYKQNETTVKKKLLYPVKKGEVLIKIKKPIKGKSGRNCKGEIIPVEKIKDFKIPKINFDEKAIKKEENEESINFLALKNGYLYEKNGYFTIKDEIKVKYINIKTGNVKRGENSDVKIDVKESDVMEEAIGDNAIVEITTLIVRGNVGNSAKIKSKNLKIMGQTHKKSKIYAKKAEINIHKGYIEGDEITIRRLEGGKVKADKVKIFQVIGGEIYAKKIEIELLGSHLTCYALEEIKIEILRGNENRLIISPERILGDTNIEKLQKKIEELRKILSVNIEEYTKKVKILKENKNSIDELKKLYLENKSKRIQTSPTIIKKIKEYQIFKEKTLKIKEKIKKLREDIEELEESIDKFQNILYLAKIISYSPWTPYNRIEFDLLEPPVKLTYDTKGNEGLCGFKLKDYGDSFKIVKIRLKDKNDSSVKG